MTQTDAFCFSYQTKLVTSTIDASIIKKGNKIGYLIL